MENKYQNGKIYKIISSQTDKIYVGSTCETLRRRFNRHKNRQSHYISSNEIIKYEDAKIILLEDYSCDNKRELEEKEREYILLYKNICVNMIIPAGNRAEYHKNIYSKTESYKQFKYSDRKQNILCCCLNVSMLAEVQTTLL